MSKSQQEIATPDKRITQKVRSQKSLSVTKKLTYTAVFAALAIVMKFVGQFLTITPSFKITLIYCIWLIAAAVLGPVRGGAVCFISDVLGALIIPTGAMNPLLIIGNTLYGIIAGLTFKFTPGRFYSVKFIVSGIACTLICTCLINSAAIWYWYKYYETMSFPLYFAAYRALQPAVAAINIAITVAMIPLIKKLGLLPEPNKKGEKENA